MTRPMDIQALVAKGTVTLKKDFELIVPTVAANVISSLLMMAAIKEAATLEDLVESSEMIQAFFLAGFIGLVISVFAFGVTVGMALEIRHKGKTSLSTGLMLTMKLFPRLLIASLLLSLAISFGMFFYLIPGLLIAMVLMYTMPAMMSNSLSPLEATTFSIKLFRERARDTFVLYSFLLSSLFVVFLIQLVIGLVPILGPIAGLLLMGIYGAVSATIILNAYDEFTVKSVSAEDLTPDKTEGE